MISYEFEAANINACSYEMYELKQVIKTGDYYLDYEEELESIAMDREEINSLVLGLEKFYKNLTFDNVCSQAAELNAIVKNDYGNVKCLVSEDDILYSIFKQNSKHF